MSVALLVPQAQGLVVGQGGGRKVRRVQGAEGVCGVLSGEWGSGGSRGLWEGNARGRRLETRQGMSWGGVRGGVAPVREGRLRVRVLGEGGAVHQGRGGGKGGFGGGNGTACGCWVDGEGNLEWGLEEVVTATRGMTPSDPYHGMREAARS